MIKKVAWIDRFYKNYQMDEISDSHLLNILGFMCNGGGHAHFLTVEKIKNLFDEADRRNLRHKNDIVDAFESRDLKDFINELGMCRGDIG